MIGGGACKTLRHLRRFKSMRTAARHILECFPGHEPSHSQTMYGSPVLVDVDHGSRVNSLPSLRNCGTDGKGQCQHDISRNILDDAARRAILAREKDEVIIHFARTPARLM